MGERLPKTVQTALSRPQSALSLLVLGSAHIATHALPSSGEVTLGRDGDCDIVIDDVSVSRRHARLRLGESITIEDLGSSNGTLVRDLRLTQGEPASTGAGDVLTLGAVNAIIQVAAAREWPRRIWTHGYFEGRVDEECARADRLARPFAVLRIHHEPAQAGVIEDCLVTQLRAYDVVGAYGPGELDVLVTEVSPEQTDVVVQRLTGAFAAAGVMVRLGVAHHPGDGRDANSLIARASARLKGAGPHTVSSPEIAASRGMMARLEELVARVAAGSISVLILGETGVGKEVFAEKIHRLSPRRDKPFLGLNCAALSETLLESELFGHERGAFTNAHQAKPGLLETADGGTIFLDEVGELQPAIQVKLLRVIEEKRVLRVGGLKPRPIEVRFIAATNRNLESEVEQGTFRRDLYYRLNGVTIVVPALRDRTDEIAGLAAAFLTEAASSSSHASPPPISREALSVLEQYSWPGNIRELRNVMERAFLLAAGSQIGLEHLPTEKMNATLARRSRPDPAPPPSQSAVDTDLGREPPPRAAVREELASIERRTILDALQRCMGNQTEAAKLLGVSRRTLIRRIAEYDLPRPRKPRIG